MEIIKLNTKHLKDFYAIKSERAKKPFLNNMKECRSIKLLKTDIVADIGAYVGEYSVYCINSGVKEVHSYEPTFDTFKILGMNKRGNMHLHNMAVVGDDSKTVVLNISKGIGVTNSIAKSAGKASTEVVEAIQYEKAVKNVTVVKIDVEGAEYSYNIIQPQLRAIILEFHPIVGIDWKKKANGIMKKINKAGFKTIMKPRFTHGWDVTASFERKLLK